MPHTTRKLLAAGSLVVSAVVGACGSGVPDTPTYFADVQPILRANCARCHGADPIDPKVAKFRLDRYVKGDTSTFDAYDYATGADPAMTRVAVDLESPAMPPDYELTDRQREILDRWVAAGAPKGTRGNHEPEIELIAPGLTAAADASLEVTIRTWDVDLDGLVVQLWAHDQTANDDIPLGAPIGGGLRTSVLDTGTLASRHRFEIYAVLDDGFDDEPTNNRSRWTIMPDVLVDHGTRGTAPTVKLVTPNGGDTLIGTVPVTWTATDPDRDETTGAPDELTISLDLLQIANDGSAAVVTSIASGLANTGTYSWQIAESIPATTSNGASIPYRLRVTATDRLGNPPNTRSDDSDSSFTIQHATTTSLTWADIQPLMDKYCGKCHAEPARTVALDNFCFLQYEAGEAVPPCGAGDVGVYEMRGGVYNRVVAMRNMPPAVEPQPTAAEIDKIGNWILGGAPYGTGPADQRPTLTWSSPGAAVLDASASGVAMLAWNVSDAEGLASDAIEATKVAGSPNCSNVVCSMIAAPSWTAVTNATLTGTADSRTFAWSRPAGPTAAGCYCVRGTVTDTANQSSTTTAAKAVRF